MRGHVAAGHASMRVHVGVHVGRHVAVRSEIVGPMGIVGLGKRVGAVTLIIFCLRSPYLTASFPNVFSVWDYVPTRVLPCRTRGGTANGGSTGIA